MKNNYFIDCERMKYPNTGLYKFCEHLGWSLLKQKNENEEISFYVSPNELNYFGKEFNYLKQNFIHKLFFPKISKNAVWHTTYQETEYFPYHTKNPLVLTIHDINFMHSSEKSAYKKKYLLRQLKAKISRANHIVFISEFVKNNVNEFIDLDLRNCSVVYNGCNFYKDISITDPKQKHQRDFLFTISSISPKKNIHVLPALLVNNDFDLIIAGNNHDKKYIQLILNEAKKINVENRVIFTGPLSENDKNWYYLNCKAFLFPSLAEGFGMPVVEAMSFGKPIFLSNKTSLPEIGADAAFYFDSFDSKDMQSVFEKGIQKYESNNLAESIIAQAKRFDWAKAANDYLNIYRCLC